MTLVDQSRDFDETTIVFLGMEIGGTVYHLVDAAALTVYNITKSDHPLRYGEVARSIIVRNGQLTIRTIGEGNNISAVRALTNMKVFQDEFDGLDSAARDFVKARLP